ncbi:cache domain-containing sensor histidine kinase [Paenibacillus abyssi]|nr:sensor histidine kinase [Paenibacillus abyssi]
MKFLFPRHTLRTKLVATALVCILVPMLITLSASEWLTRDLLRKNAEDNAFQSLQIANESVITILNNMIYVANFIQFDPELNTLLREQLDEPFMIQDYEQYSKQIKLMRTLETLSFSGEKLFISILLPNGKTFSNYANQSYEPRNMISEPWFLAIQDQLPYEGAWLGVHENYWQDQSASPYLITAVRPLKLTTGSNYAYIFVSMDERRLHKVWGDDRSGQEMMLIDQNGKILSHLDPLKIGTQGPSFRSYSEQSESMLVQLGDIDFLMARMETSFYDWNLISLTPYKEAVGKITGISRSILLTLLLFFSIFLIILILLIRQFTKPILRLSGIVRKIDEGNLEIRSQVRGMDEIGVLGRALDNMLDRIKEMIHKIKYEQQLKRKAEIDMLQAQINPHFLFNILNSIRMRILLKGDQENAGIIESLSTVLRMTIDRNNAFVTLREEVEIVGHYLQLMNFRRRQPIHLVADLNQDTLLREVPRFIIQPLIENACMHGIKQHGGCITVKAQIVEDALIIIVEDDGDGMEPVALDQLNRKLGMNGPGNDRSERKLNGIGLTNVAERIRIIYGAASGMTVESKLGEGTRITLNIPTKSEEENGHV